MTTQKTFIYLIVFVIVAVGIGIAISGMERKPAKYDQFAQCLKDKGAIFYGAFWCPHCQAQKKLFGRSAKLLPYVECSTADGKNQLPVCKDKKVESYPTWELADGTRLETENTAGVSLETLSEKTQCPLPQ